MKKLLLIFIICTAMVSGCGADESSKHVAPQPAPTTDAEDNQKEASDASDAIANEEETKVSEEVTAENGNEEKKTDELPVFDADSLSKYNGEDGMPAYVAVDGVVYDISEVAGCKGLNRGTYSPGMDCSSIINQSRHGKSVLADLPVIGSYEN